MTSLRTAYCSEEGHPGAESWPSLKSSGVAPSGTVLAFNQVISRWSSPMWLDSFAHVRPRDADRLAGAGIQSTEALLGRLTDHNCLRALARETGIDEQRLLSLAVQAQFLRLRAPTDLAQAS